MTVPRDILIKSPKLHAAFENKLPELPDIPEDIGHVLVHYLHTGTYESLKPKEPLTPSKQIVELKTSIKAYAAARAYDLPELMRLAQQQIEKYGEGLPLPSLLEITRDSFPTLSEHDDWFLDYLKSRIRPHLADPKSILGSDLLDRISGILSPNKVLLRTVLEMFCERILPRKEPIATITSPASSRPSSPPPVPAKPISLLQMRSRAIVREESSPLKKQATPLALPEPELAAITALPKDGASEPVAERVQEHKVHPSTEHELESHKPVVQIEPATSFKIEAEPVLKEEELWRPTVMPINRERKDSGKLLDLDPEWGLGPVIKDIDPVAEPETPERERPGKRILREVDSGFWEFSPSEPEQLHERPPSVVEILPAPIRELEPVQEIDLSPEPKKADDLVEKRDFAATQDGDSADKGKSVEPEQKVPETLDLVPVPVPVPAPFAEPTTQSPPQLTELSDIAPEQAPEKAELVGSEVMSDTVKVEPNLGKPEPKPMLTIAQPETSRPEPDNKEAQPEPKAETPAEPELLSHDPQPAEHPEPKTTEPLLESQPEPPREPEIPTADSHAPVEPTDTPAKPAALPLSDPAPQQESTTVSSDPTRQKSWKRKLSLRYPVLFGRGM